MLHISRRNPADSLEIFSSSGTHVLYHLAADGACLAGSQVAVVAVGQVDTDLGSSLHLELVHSLTSLGNIDLVVVIAHLDSLLLSIPESGCFPAGEHRFSFRTPILTKVEMSMNVNWRKEWRILESNE